MIQKLIKKLYFLKDATYFEKGLKGLIKSENKLLDDKFILNNYLYTIIDKNLDYDFIISIIFPELYLNICHHSGTKNALYFFSECSDENKMEIIFLDTGVGIPKKIKKYFKDKKFKNDAECIEYALQYSITTKSLIQNYGRGLDTIKSCISANHGELKIISNKGIYSCINSQRILSERSHNFKGTLIYIKIDLNNLENKQEIDYSNEINFNYDNKD